MTTYGAVFLEGVAEAIRVLNELTHNPFEPGDVREILSSTGTKTEIFLKAVALPAESSKKSFEFFIDALPPGSIDSPHRSALHALRMLYNKAKHEPTYEVQVLEALQAITNAEAGFRQIVASGVGHSNNQSIPSSRRVYWISACDHCISGETEVHVHIPGETTRWLGVPTFDHVNIAGLEWDDVKAELAAVGKLKEGNGIIPQARFDAFVSDDDSLTPLVFEGAYRDLLVILATHELRLDLIPGLRRVDSEWSMVVAVLMAACDVTPVCTNPSHLSTEIHQHATNAYGIPPSYANLTNIVQGIVQMISQAAHSEWSRLRGPAWAREDVFSARKTAAIATHPSLPIVVTPDFEVVVEWSHI